MTKEPAIHDPRPVRVAEIAGVLGISRQAVLKRANRGEFGKRVVDGGCLYGLENFRDQAFADRIRARRESQVRQAAKAVLIESFDKPVNVMATSALRPLRSLLELSDAQRERALARAHLLIWIDNRKAERGCSDEVAVAQAKFHAMETPDCPFGCLLASGLSSRGGKPTPSGGCQITLSNVERWRRWWRPYRSKDRNELAGYAALADAYCTTQRLREGDERYWIRIAYLYEAQNNISLRDAWDAALKKGCELGWGESPAYHQVRYYYQRKVDRAAVHARRAGEKWIYNTLDTTIRRDWSELKPGAMWFSDHHEFNVFVRIPAPWAPGYWIAVRPWITQFLDCPTFHEVASVIRGRDPDGDVILDTWRRAVEDLGWCAAAVYFDNGKDYRSIGGKKGRHVSPLVEKHCATTAQILGVRAIFAQPFNARTKPCELDFGITERKWERTWATYCGHNAERFKLLYPLLKREKLATFDGENNPVKGCLINPELVPTLEEFSSEYYRWRSEERERMASDGIMLNGQSPEQAWRSSLSQCNRPTIDAETQFLAFLRSFNRPQKVDRGAVVWLKRGESKRDWIRFHSRALEPFLISGEEVLVKVDVQDVSHAYVFQWIEQQGWKLIRCEGPHGGCPALADIPANTGMEQVRDVQRANRSRRKAIRTGVEAANQEQIIREWRQHTGPATDTEVSLRIGQAERGARIQEYRKHTNALRNIEVPESETAAWENGGSDNGS